MPDTPLPTTKQKMALTERERQLIMEHRAKTATDRAFNDGLDHALEVLPLSLGDYFESQKDRDEMSTRLAGWLAKIESARRDV